MIKNCELCKHQFATSQPLAKFCSQCRVEANVIRNQEYRARQHAKQQIKEDNE